MDSTVVITVPQSLIDSEEAPPTIIVTAIQGFPGPPGPKGDTVVGPPGPQGLPGDTRLPAPVVADVGKIPIVQADGTVLWMPVPNVSILSNILPADDPSKYNLGLNYFLAQNSAGWPAADGILSCDKLSNLIINQKFVSNITGRYGDSYYRTWTTAGVLLADDFASLAVTDSKWTSYLNEGTTKTVNGVLTIDHRQFNSNSWLSSKAVAVTGDFDISVKFRSSVFTRASFPIILGSQSAMALDPNIDTSGFVAGFARKTNGWLAAYNPPDGYRDLQMFDGTVDHIYRITRGGNTVTWYLDGVQVYQKSGLSIADLYAQLSINGIGVWDDLTGAIGWTTWQKIP